jgi:hypothetical protein
MSFRPSARRLGALALVAGAAAAAACSSDPDVRGLTAPTATNAPFLLRYVALGNSITAGYQSDGINDSTQRASFANLLARAAGVRFAYPSLAGNGCPAPLTNLLTQARVGAVARDVCPGRASATELLNNVAVPGANSFDPTGLGVGTTAGSIGGYSALTRVILGNVTQVQKAIQANPTFASVWIGNNDVLSFAIGGDTATRSRHHDHEPHHAAERVRHQLRRAGQPAHRREPGAPGRRRRNGREPAARRADRRGGRDQHAADLPALRV